MAGVTGYPEPEFAVANSGEGLVIVAGDGVFREPEFAGANSGERLVIVAGDGVFREPEFAVANSGERPRSGFYGGVREAEAAPGSAVMIQRGHSPP